GDAVEPRQHSGPLGRWHRHVPLDPGAFLPHQEGDNLICRAAAWPDLAALRGGLDLPDGPGQDRDDALVVPGAETTPVARRGSRRAGTARSSLCQVVPSTESNTMWSRSR